VNPAETSLMTVEQLAARVAETLSHAAVAGELGELDGRTREVPDLRTIRYYTTLGLLDRPTAMRGRTALYGRRHLLQLVAVKRLQARGRSLAEAQRELYGLPDAELEAIARIPGESEVRSPKSEVRDGEAVADPPQTPAPRREFWKSQPAEPEPVPPRPAETGNGSAVLQPQAVELAEGVVLLIADPRRPVGPGDVEAVRAAAAPLIKVLSARRLSAAPHQEERETP
jgi:DNA-binding transcriptional MerR regulator